ncbi:hypothetical protein IQ268_06720 [Oculatella sp. LEGE 06141]|uniref:hypothetical protein n=1 Tax=Oculatella sp. LEGE 06141 TaxID=1828648 RepID=UPI00187FD408|nr:hypothetical protein [Oculatella sp. LEGE 06141]MBE9178278.1 hypothetical protein [Oculatella sp. LEGE 06141]
MIADQQLDDANGCCIKNNPTIIALQRLIVKQYEQFMQQSSQSTKSHSGNSQTSVALPRAKVADQVELTQE